MPALLPGGTQDPVHQCRVWQWVQGLHPDACCCLACRCLCVPRPSLTHRQTIHAERCYRQHDILHGFSRLFHVCHMCSGWTCPYLWKAQGATGGAANQAPLCQAVSTEPTRGCKLLKPPSWSLFLIVLLETLTIMACWWSFCSFGSAHPVPPWFWSLSCWCVKDLLLSFPALLYGISSMLLRVCWETTDLLAMALWCDWDVCCFEPFYLLRLQLTSYQLHMQVRPHGTADHTSTQGPIDVPFWRSWTTCATYVGSKYHLMLPAVTLTLTKYKISERKSEKRKSQCPPPVKPFLFWGLSHCCPFSAAVVNFMNLKTAETD